MVWYDAFLVCCFEDWCSTVELKTVATLGALQMKMTATCSIQKFHWREKNKTLVKILGGGRQHRTTPTGQILGGRDSCTPCGVDAYGSRRCPVCSRCSRQCKSCAKTSIYILRDNLINHVIAWRHRKSRRRLVSACTARMHQNSHALNRALPNQP